MPRTFPGDENDYGRVISVTPNHGPASGGTPVVVSGAGSDWPSVVAILNPVAGLRIVCVTPEFTPGPARVTAQAGVHRDNAFTYTVVPAPSIDEIKPKLGPEDGAIALHITGSGFKEGHQ